MAADASLPRNPPPLERWAVRQDMINSRCSIFLSKALDHFSFPLLGETTLACNFSICKAGLWRTRRCC